MRGKQGLRSKRERTKGSRARTVPVVWLLLAVITVAALTVWACALWLPDRAPALLGAGGEATSAPAGVQEYSGGQQVTVVPTMSADRELIGNATGTVTTDWSGEGLTSGRRAYRVNDRMVVALATASPLYRDLKANDTGDDVRALNDELNRLGYRSSPGSNRYTWRTVQGVSQLMKDNGNTSDGSLALADTLWIPSPQVAVGSWTASQGLSVTAGSSVGSIGGTIVKLAIKNGQPSDRDRTITVLGQSGTLPAGATEVTDAGFCAKVAATPEFTGMPKDARSTGFDATVTLPEPIRVLRVPSGAVFGIDGQSGCIVPASSKGTNGGRGSDDPIKVTIIGGELGASLVSPTDASGASIDPSSITRVTIGRALDGLSCGR
ncbi:MULTISPECIES: peptidoglycan-binding protein [unclassified Bifidobacterium]|uniref:peptidoglycan-binding domain-containing protein n=1 Tax=unclassified Bifidobacterium TaxID=2608897 RepID=UPI00112825A0|nr:MULTISPECIES: hypothetical protein [unclassified Bifidobacterium]